LGRFGGRASRRAGRHNVRYRRARSRSFDGAFAKSAAQEAKIPDVSDCVQGAVIWYGLFDLAPFVTAVNTQGPAVGVDVADALGCKRGACDDQAALASPAAHVPGRRRRCC